MFGRSFIRLVSSLAPLGDHHRLLNQKLLKCTTLSQVEELTLNSSPDELNDANLATAVSLLHSMNAQRVQPLNRILECASQTKFHPQALVLFLSSAHPLFDHLPHFILDQLFDKATVRSLSGNDLAVIFHALLNYNQASEAERLVHSVLKRSTVQFEPKDVISILYSLDVLNLPNVDLLERFSQSIINCESLKELQGQDFVYLVHICATWKFSSELLFDKLVEELVQRRDLQDMKNDDLFQVMDGLWSLGYKGEELGAHFEQEMEARSTKEFFRKWNRILYTGVLGGSMYLMGPEALRKLGEFF